MELDRQNPHSIVTWGGGGIGATTVEQLVSRGCQVTCFNLAPHPDGQINSALVDVTDARAVEGAVHRAGERYGTVTGLVARHGVRGAFVPALEIDGEQLRKHYDLHVVGTFHVSREIAALLDGTAASMVFVSSITAYGGGFANQIMARQKPLSGNSWKTLLSNGFR